MKYKLTDKDGKTQAGTENQTQWGENVTHKAKARGRTLCTNQVIHYYDDPYLAILMNPVHGCYEEKTMLLWEGKARKIAGDNTKSGCKTFTTIRQIPIPELTIETKIEISIHLTLQMYDDKSFRKWAVDWLDGKNRITEVSWATWAARAAWAAWAAAKVAEAAGAETRAAAAAEAIAEAIATMANAEIVLETIYDVIENKRP